MPLIVSWPGRFTSGVRREALVELTDIAPTLLDVAGLEAPERMAGHSLRRLLAGAGEEDAHRQFVRCEYYRALSLLAPGREQWEGSYATMIRTERYKLAVYHGHDVGELFDLEADPGEFENLWDRPDFAELRFELLKTMLDQSAFSVDYGSDTTEVY